MLPGAIARARVRVCRDAPGRCCQSPSTRTVGRGCGRMQGESFCAARAEALNPARVGELPPKDAKRQRFTKCYIEVPDSRLVERGQPFTLPNVVPYPLQIRHSERISRG